MKHTSVSGITVYILLCVCHVTPIADSVIRLRVSHTAQLHPQSFTTQKLIPLYNGYINSYNLVLASGLCKRSSSLQVREQQ